MLSRSFFVMCKARWKEFMREPSAFFWVVFMPILWMLILGFAFSKPPAEKYGIAIWKDLEFKQNSVDYISPIENQAQITPYQVEDQKQLYKLFKRGKVVGAVKVEGAKNIRFLFDPINPESQHALRLIREIAEQAAGQRELVKISEQPIEVEGGRYVDFLVPGLLGLSIMTSSLFGIGMTIVSNRKENLLKRYLATPMSKSEFLLSHIVGRALVLGVEFSCVVLSAYLIFGHQVQGSLISYFLFSALGAAVFTAITLLCASRTKSLPAIGGMLNLIILPMMLLSGVFFSRDRLPEWLQGIVQLLPLTALNDGLRKIALEGVDITSLGAEAIVLFIYLAIAGIITRLAFKWY